MIDGWSASSVEAVCRNVGWCISKDFDDRTAVEAFTNAALFAEPSRAWRRCTVGSPVGWIAQVVETDGHQRGTCISVIANPAHDILELDSGALVPVIFVLACVDGVITIDPPDGLFDLDS